MSIFVLLMSVFVGQKLEYFSISMGIGLGAIELSVRSMVNWIIVCCICDSELFVFDGFGDEAVFVLAMLLLEI